MIAHGHHAAQSGIDIEPALSLAVEPQVVALSQLGEAQPEELYLSAVG